MCAALLVCVPLTATAQSDPTERPPPPGEGQRIWQTAERGRYLHDGFYLSAGAGAGLVQAQFNNSAVTGSPWVSGTGIAYALGIGGAIADGWTIGGRFLDVLAPSANGVSEIRSNSSPGADRFGSFDASDLLWFSMVQLFVDAYPMPKRGLHLQAGLGPASLQFRHQTYYSDVFGSESSVRTQTSYGIGGSIAIGWEGWIEPEWSAGALLSLSAAQLWGDPTMFDLSNNSVKSSITVLSPALLVTFTYN